MILFWFRQIFFVIISIILLGCKSNNSGKQSSKVKVPVITLHTHSINVSQTYIADIQGVQFVEVKPKVTGFIQAIYVDEGKKVKRGSPLFQLSTIEYTEGVKEAQAHLKQAEAKFQMATYEVSRIRRLVEKNIISPIRLEQVNTELEVARLEVEQSKSKLGRSQINLGYTTVSAPYDGCVDRIPYKIGSLVDTETVLTSITDVSEIFAYYRVNESEYLKFKRLQLSGELDAERSRVRLILSDGSFYDHEGTVETVEGDFERGTGSIAFRARFPNPEGLLKHGITGKVSMTNKMTNIYLVPQRSTFEIQEFTYVYVVDKDGIARIRSFEPLGRQDGFYITDDFSDSTRIVYMGLQNVRDGIMIDSELVTCEEFTEQVTQEHSKKK